MLSPLRFPIVLACAMLGSAHPSTAAATHAAQAVHFVSPAGSDEAPGTRDMPWRTLAHACRRAVAGTTVYMLDGVYRETLAPQTSGTAEAPVTFAAAQGCRPVISGCDLLGGGKLDSHGIWQAPVGWDLGSGRNQIFWDAQPLTEARHPNAVSADPMKPGLIAVRFHGPDQITADAFRSAEPNMWKGAWFFGYGHEAWAYQCAQVAASAGDRVSFDPASRSSPWFRGDPKQRQNRGAAGFLFGLEAMLDAPGEWFRDSTTLKVVPPAGHPQATTPTVEARRRPWCVDLSNQHHIVVRGLALRAGAVRVQGDHNLIEDCESVYASHFLRFTNGYSQDGGSAEGSAVDLGGNDNVVRRCRIAMTAGCGILVKGRNNEVSRCLIEDIDYAGIYGAGITLGGSEAKILFNTIRRTGRDCIHIARATPGAPGGGNRILFNDASAPGQLCKDTGIFYAFGQNGMSAAGQHTRIAYNWFHDHPAPMPSPGIYLDNYTRNFLVDHNVVWNVPHDAGVRVNGPSLGCRIYHNTLFHTRDIGTFTYRRFDPATNPDPAFWTSKDMYAYDSRNNLYLADRPAAQLVDPANARFMLKPGAKAIDAGQAMAIEAGLSPIGGFAGKAPDLGAYENQQAAWKPGRDGWAPDSEHP